MRGWVGDGMCGKIGYCNSTGWHGGLDLKASFIQWLYGQKYPWIWKLHSTKGYTVKSAYENLTSVDVDFNVSFNHVLWLKMIPLNFNILIWRLLLNWLPTKDLLVRRRVLVVYDNRSSFRYLRSIWYHVVLDFRLAWYLDGFFMETFRIICCSLAV